MNGADFGYCGPAPIPADLWVRWNLDPVLILVLSILTAGGYVLLRERQAKLAFSGAMAGLFILFVSPLCALGVALASARIGHHVALTVLVAPLMALALPVALRRVLAQFAIPALVLHTAAFWAWHHPTLYDTALASPLAYWAMQASLLVSAVAVWGAAFSARLTTSLGLLLGTSMQMGFLAAILVFASDPIYAGHLTKTASFGLSPLTDQQLGGLLMWVPASLPYIGLAMVRLAKSLRPSGTVAP
jgi:putative membrane protein